MLPKMVHVAAKSTSPRPASAVTLVTAVELTGSVSSPI